MELKSTRRANIPLIKKNLKPLSFTEVNQNDYVMSLLGIYENNDVSLFRDLYSWAYKKSAQRYSAMQQAMGEPDTFKLKYRQEIQEIIKEIIVGKIAGDQLVPKIHQLIAARSITETDTPRLFEIIETEIMSLHDGNIARFKIKPSEFQQWQAIQAR